VRFVVFYGGAVTKGLPQFIDSWAPQKFDVPARIEPKKPPLTPTSPSSTEPRGEPERSPVKA
jgi:hypothetical protein